MTWTLEYRRNGVGAWLQLDRFHDRDAAVTALVALLKDFHRNDDVRLRRERHSNTERVRYLPPTDDTPELVTREASHAT